MIAATSLLRNGGCLIELASRSELFIFSLPEIEYCKETNVESTLQRKRFMYKICIMIKVCVLGELWTLDDM
jgi:hypothetical protein